LVIWGAQDAEERLGVAPRGVGVSFLTLRAHDADL
jgi:hypothetical protein